MDVRKTRDGVPELFKRDRVTLVMQQALAQRYAHPLPPPLSDEWRSDRHTGVKCGNAATLDITVPSPSLAPHLVCPQHYTVRRCSRTEYYLDFIPSHRDQRVGSVRPRAAQQSTLVSAPWQVFDDEMSVAIEVAGECWRHTAFTELTETDLHNLCRLPKVDAVGSSGCRSDTVSSLAPLSAASATLHSRRFSSAFVSRQDFCEMPPRWVMQSLSEVDQHMFESFDEWLYRRHVTPLDVGATVVTQEAGAGEAPYSATAARNDALPQTPRTAPLSSHARRAAKKGGVAPGSSSSPCCISSSPSEEVDHVPPHQKCFRVLATGSMSRGAYWVSVAPLATQEEETMARGSHLTNASVSNIVVDEVRWKRVDRDDVRLHPPVALYVDPLLPCDELYSDRGVNTGVFIFFLRALQQHQRGLGKGRSSRDTASSDGGNSDSGMRPGSVGDVSDPFETAASLAVRLSLCARHRRRELARRIDRAIAAANGSTSQQCARLGEPATSMAPDATAPSSELPGYTVPTVLLQVRVDSARDSLQLRALVQEGVVTPSNTSVSGGELSPTVHAAVDPSSAHAPHPTQYTAVSRRAGAKRPREEAEVGKSLRGFHFLHTHPMSPSPTVGVLLRSAYKLASLYDMTCSVVQGHREAVRDAAEGYTEAKAPNCTGAEACASTPTPTTPSSGVAVSMMTRLAGMWQSVSGASASEARGLPSEAPHDSGWRTVMLCTGGAHPPSTGPVAEEVVLGPEPCAPPVDSPITASVTEELIGGHPSTDAAAANFVGDHPRFTISTTGPERIFLARLFRLLLRYRTLFGEHGYNQGPHAAVPPPVMEQLASTFEISAEAFASPLNAQLPQYGSLFPDTDVFFGSLGSFFDLHFGGTRGAAHSSRSPTSTGCTASPLSGCHIEVNPPFDTTLLRHMATHLLLSLEGAEGSPQSLLFLVVLPSHDMTDAEKAAAAESAPQSTIQQPARTKAALRLGNDKRCGGGITTACAPVTPSTDRLLRESSYCLGHVLCTATESAYVDGHQHLLQSPFFRIETPTRLILLGNTAARVRFPHAVSQLESVRETWRVLTEAALRQRSPCQSTPA